jgi:predicted nucleotidyltransferase
MSRKRTISPFFSIKRRSLPILKRHNVIRAAIFGSFARGTATAKSDIDFLIEYRSKNKSLLDLVGLKLDLEERLDRKVDIVTYSSINWRLRERILAEQVVIL